MNDFHPCNTVTATRQSAATLAHPEHAGARTVRAPSRSRLRRAASPFFLAAAALSVCFTAAADHSLSLAGPWRFQLDRADAGIAEHWFDLALPDKVRLPGGLTEQGIGDPPSVDTKWVGRLRGDWHRQPELADYVRPGNFKFPYWLTPERYYAGAAWYQRDVNIPPDWAGKRVVLFLERPHWETRVWVDGRALGANSALGTPHEYDLGQLAPGKHALTIRVDNRMIVDVGENSHSVSDHTQGNWNGIVGKIELRATPRVWIEEVRVEPGVARKAALVRVRIGNASGQAGTGQLAVVAALQSSTGGAQAEARKTVAWDAGGGRAELEVRLGEAAPLWDEFNPALYTLTATLLGADGSRGTQSVPFGLRDIAADGTQFTMNGRKTFIRGTLDCCIYPKTGHPPTDVESWKRVINVCKAHGLNLIRFHSWCPPAAAFEAADALGFYFQVEASSWANQSTTLGDGKPVDQWIYEETDRILKYYGNHPSFVLMTYGNEPGGKNAGAFLARYVAHYKAHDPRRLWTSGAGWPQLVENQFHVTPDPRIQGWGEGLQSRINARPPETVTDYRDYIRRRSVPVISHEIGQWCVYPNFDEISKYTGHLKPKNFEIFRDSLKAHHMGDQAQLFLLASGKLQTLCYKEDIESALRTPGMGGFQLLDLHDFPGQGTALVGVLDPFWDEKGYVTAAAYRRFCNSTVPLARLAKRVFTTDETLQATLEIAHFGPAPWVDAATEWHLVDEAGKVHGRGELPRKTLPVDNGVELGRVDIPLKDLPAPANYKLVVAVDDGSGRASPVCERYENDWDVWVYPARVDSAVPGGITVVDELNDAAVEQLKAGGKVLLMIPPARVAPDRKLGRVALGFSSIFWNTAWTGRQPPHTLGLLCDPKHPLFAAFPTGYHSNWQWWYLIHRAGAMILDGLPADLRPTVQVIDDWVTNRKLGLVFEAKLGAGKLVVCSMDLDPDSDLARDPVRRQFRHSLLRYMTGTDFNPAHRVTPEQIRALTREPSAMQQLGARAVETDSEEAGHEAANAIDGDPQTVWHTTWRSEPKGFPHHLIIGFRAPVLMRGFTALPRQDGIRNGWIRDWVFYASDDGEHWGEPVAKGSFEADKELKTVLFQQPLRVRYVRLVALAGFAGPHASLAEFEVLTEAESPLSTSPFPPQTGR